MTVVLGRRVGSGDPPRQVIASVLHAHPYTPQTHRARLGRPRTGGDPMRGRTAVAVAVAAMLTQSAQAQSAGRIQFQVSPALQENWSSSLDVLPGQAVDLRALISYTGVQSPIGLAAVLYQPAISNWDA